MGGMQLQELKGRNLNEPESFSSIANRWSQQPRIVDARTKLLDHASQAMMLTKRPMEQEQQRQQQQRVSTISLSIPQS